MQLENRIAIITGATGGLGRVVTLRFLAEGALVYAPYRSASRRDRLIAEAGDAATRLVFRQCDVTDETSVDTFVSNVLGEAGRIDALANLTGAFVGSRRASETALDTWESMLATNLRSTFLCCRAVLPLMTTRGYGRITAVAARTAVRPMVGAAAYSVAKAGVIALMRTIAEEVKSLNVTANVILPSIIDTAANREAMPKADPKKWVTPEEIAESIVFLSSDRSKGVNGAEITMYGAM